MSNQGIAFQVLGWVLGPPGSPGTVTVRFVSFVSNSRFSRYNSFDKPGFNYKPGSCCRSKPAQRWQLTLVLKCEASVEPRLFSDALYEKWSTLKSAGKRDSVSQSTVIQRAIVPHPDDAVLSQPGECQI